MKQDKFPLPIKISWYAAIIYSAISLPVELVRRWHQLTDLHYFIAWFDEFIISGFLLYSVWRTWKSLSDGQRFLTASWGFASGMMFAGFFIQLNNRQLPDPTPVPIEVVLIVKGVFFSVCVVGLILSLIKIKDE